MILRIVSCAGCNTEHEISINPDDWKAWRDGALIQRVIPYLTDEQRELLISQICGVCWKEMFKEDDEDV